MSAPAEATPAELEDTFMTRPLIHARRWSRVALAGLVTLSLCAAALLFVAAVDGAEGLPRELLGFRLGEKIDAVKTSSWGLTIKSRTMVLVSQQVADGPPPGPEVVIYKDCPVRVADRCAPGPKPEDIPRDRPDEPGSLTLVVTRFGEPRLLGLEFELNLDFAGVSKVDARRHAASRDAQAAGRRFGA